VQESAVSVLTKKQDKRAEGYTKEQTKEYGQLIDLFISIGK
jgi:hypothetical protein